MDPNANYAIRQLSQKILELEAQIDAVAKPSSMEDELNKIPGRRVLYTLMGEQSFTSTQDGAQGSPITFEISQDGPWVMTHYPMVLWRVNAPSNATNFGQWRPVSIYPLPDQVEDSDVINISYKLSDSGSGRNMQNDPFVHAGMLSTPDEWKKLPQPVYFRPQSVVSFTPRYEDILFDSGGTATTGGLLSVALPGYKIVNLG